MAIGFADLADLGVEEWKRRGPNDLIFIPIVYCYRHALELVLKAALRTTAACLREEGETDPALDRDKLNEWLAGPRGAGHSLQKLATRLDEWLKSLDAEALPDDVHEVLKSLHQLDPKGDAFRYSTVRGKGGTFERAPRPGLTHADVLQAHVDVAAMQKHFQQAFGLLSDGLMTELDEVRSWQADRSADADW